MPILLNCAARTNYLTVVSNVRMFFEQLSNAMPTSVRADDIQALSLQVVIWFQ